MRIVGWVLTALVLSSCGVQGRLQMDLLPTTGVIGGTVVAENSQIGQTTVAIYDDLNKTICTGSLLTENVVITAAHCVFDTQPGKLRIVFAGDVMAVLSTSEQDIKQQLMRDVVSFKYHEQYNPGEQDENPFDWSDIALIKFKGSLPEGFRPATLLPDLKMLKAGMTATMAGYGVTKVTANPVEARKVKNLKQKIADGEVSCDDNMENCLEIEMTGDGELHQTEAQIAYVIRSEVRVDESKGHGTCSGDSGGPIYIQQNGEYYLFGVTSRGNGMCDKVGIYTNILYFQSWVQYNLKLLN